MGCGVHTGNVAYHVNAATRNPALPANLASLIDRCLAPDPAGRYRNGGKLATALRSLSTIAQVSPEAVPALAILDFTNLAGEHALDWLGAGIAETLAARLSKLNSLRVATRSLVHQAAARLGVNDPSTIGRHLEAKWVVTGSFLKVADRVRITPQLIEAATGETSFAETIDGKWDDIFDLQDKAAHALANHLGGAGPQSPLPSLSRNLLAYESYSKGRQFLSQMRPSALASAIEQFEQAIALDPDYALANSALGTSYALQFLRTSNPEDAKRAGGYLERAIILDPEIGEPYPWLCNARIRRNDAAGAVAAGKKGVELHPDLGIAHYFYGGAAYMIAEARLIEPSVGVARLLEGIRLEPQRQGRVQAGILRRAGVQGAGQGAG